MPFPWLERGVGTPEKPFNLLVNSDPNLDARSLGLYNLGLMDRATRIIESHLGDEQLLADELIAGYVFGSHPAALDLPPNVTHRLKETIRVMEERSPETGLGYVKQALKKHYQSTQKQLKAGGLELETTTPLQSREGKMKIKLPSAILSRTKVINSWMLGRMERPDWLTTFEDSILGTIAAKLADGHWLLAGSFMFEVVQGAGRAYSPEHRRTGLWEKWSLDIDKWYFMTHVIDAGLNQQLREIGESQNVKMINGEHLNDAVYVLGYPELLQLHRLNPALKIKGILSEGSWIWDRQLKRKFPKQGVSTLVNIAGEIVDIGRLDRLEGYPAQIGFATSSRSRNEAFVRGKYMPHLGARYLDIRKLTQVVERYNT